MQAVILAAGKSSRFYPYNQNIEQKSLISMMGKTLLEHTIDALQKANITNIVIVVGKSSLIPQILSQKKEVTISYVELSEPLGMGAAILCAKDYLEESFFVTTPYHMDIGEFVKDIEGLKSDDTSVVLVKKDDVLDRYGNVSLKGNVVLDVVEKPTKLHETSYRLAAIYLLNKKFIQTLEKIPVESDQFEKALALDAKKGLVKALVTEKPTVSLKYAWDLLGIKDCVLKNITASSISPKASVAHDALLSNAVVVEEGATIMEGVIIKGPAYIGKNVLIGNRAILRNGVIVEEKSVIGSQMEIKNSFVMDHTTTHSGFIGDSIIGRETKIAAGMVTANARLDRQSVTSVVKGEKVNTGIRHLGVIIGDKCNIGIRVSTMPGVIIGNNVVVGPSTTVMKNIGDNTKYYTKFLETVEERSEK